MICDKIEVDYDTCLLGFFNLKCPIQTKMKASFLKGINQREQIDFLSN